MERRSSFVLNLNYAFRLDSWAMLHLHDAAVSMPRNSSRLCGNLLGKTVPARLAVMAGLCFGGTLVACLSWRGAQRSHLRWQYNGVMSVRLGCVVVCFCSLFAESSNLAARNPHELLQLMPALVRVLLQ